MLSINTRCRKTSKRAGVHGVPVGTKWTAPRRVNVIPAHLQGFQSGFWFLAAVLAGGPADAGVPAERGCLGKCRPPILNTSLERDSGSISESTLELVPVFTFSAQHLGHIEPVVRGWRFRFQFLDV